MNKNFDLANFGKNFGKSTSPSAAKPINNFAETDKYQTPERLKQTAV